MSPPAELLTFEDLTEVYRKEQRAKGITEVRRDFYSAVRDCHERLRRESEREFAVDQFSTKAKLASNQLMKFREKAVQVFEFRMEKILLMALRATGGSRIDPGRLTVEERELFDKVSSLLKDRHAVLLQGSRSRAPEAEEPSLDIIALPLAAEHDGAFDPSPPAAALPLAGPVNVPAEGIPAASPLLAAPSALAAAPPGEPPAPAIEAPPAIALSPADVLPAAAAGRPVPTPDHMVLRILEDMPPIAGPGRNYRLRKEDVVSLPPSIARALIARKKAIRIQFGGPPE